MKRFIYERSATNICDWSLAYSFICIYKIFEDRYIKRLKTVICPCWLKTFSLAQNGAITDNAYQLVAIIALFVFYKAYKKIFLS